MINKRLEQRDAVLWTELSAQTDLLRLLIRCQLHQLDDGYARNVYQTELAKMEEILMDNRNRIAEG